MSPYLAIATVRYHQQKIDKEGLHNEAICKMLINFMYVDDIIGNSETVEEAMIIRKRATEIFNKMKMRIREWATNSEELLQTIPGDDIYQYKPIGRQMIAKK